MHSSDIRLMRTFIIIEPLGSAFIYKKKQKIYIFLSLDMPMTAMILLDIEKCSKDIHCQPNYILCWKPVCYCYVVAVVIRPCRLAPSARLKKKTLLGRYCVSKQGFLTGLRGIQV